MPSSAPLFNDGKPFAGHQPVQGDDRDIGSTVGPVRLIGLLGEGGMARVYLGRDQRRGVPVAVKRLRPQLAQSEHARQRLVAEADIARAINDDHVVKVLDIVHEPNGESYLVMEHLAGEPLAARIARCGALPMSETLTIARHIAAALEAVHRRGIIHRDLKTENVLVGYDEHGRLRAKLIDFGVAEILGSPRVGVEEGSVVGTPESMSPEQALAAPLDKRSDIYSYGVLLYEMTAGAPPFQGDGVTSLLRRVVSEPPRPPSELPGAQRQHIPAALEHIILECLGKRPADRPRDMTEVRARLDHIESEYSALSAALEMAVSEDFGPDVEPIELDVPRYSSVRAVGTPPAGMPGLQHDAADSTGSLPVIELPIKLIARTEPVALWERDFDLSTDPDFDLPIDEVPEIAPQRRAEVTAGATRPASGGPGPGLVRRLMPIAGAALVMAFAGASVAGMLGYIHWSPAELGLLWSR